MRENSGMTDAAQIGKRIQKQRKLHGLSQAQLAEQVSRSEHFISQIECGRRRASADTMFRIASALQISLDYLYWGPDPENPEAAELLQLIRRCSAEDLKRLEIIAGSLITYSSTQDS